MVQSLRPVSGRGTGGDGISSVLTEQQFRSRAVLCVLSMLAELQFLPDSRDGTNTAFAGGGGSGGELSSVLMGSQSRPNGRGGPSRPGGSSGGVVSPVSSVLMVPQFRPSGGGGPGGVVGRGPVSPALMDLQFRPLAEGGCDGGGDMDMTL